MGGSSSFRLANVLKRSQKGKQKHKSVKFQGNPDGSVMIFTRIHLNPINLTPILTIRYRLSRCLSTGYDNKSFHIQ